MDISHARHEEHYRTGGNSTLDSPRLIMETRLEVYALCARGKLVDGWDSILERIRSEPIVVGEQTTCSRKARKCMVDAIPTESR